jgi:2-oxoglutarate dehydrogenase E2 component (dihydrolipoamide succinyltransferase)
VAGIRYRRKAAVAGQQPEPPAVLSPAVRRAVLEHGIDPATVKGTGKDGRLTKEDVLRRQKPSKAAGIAAVSAPAPPRTRRACRRAPRGTRQDDAPAPDHRQAPEGSAGTPPLLTTFNDVDMSAVMPRATSTRTCSRRSTACGSAS